jgi:type IV pilus biogenesis protein CpaD/CtpE
MRHLYLLILVPAALVAGCQTSAVDENFGKAVAQIQRAQVNDPATLTGNQDRPVEGIDAEAATLAIESLRKDTPDRAAVKKPIAVDVGAQNGSGNQ